MSFSNIYFESMRTLGTSGVVGYNPGCLAWRRSSEEEQGTHKPWVGGSIPPGAT